MLWDSCKSEMDVTAYSSYMTAPVIVSWKLIPYACFGSVWKTRCQENPLSGKLSARKAHCQENPPSEKPTILAEHGSLADLRIRLGPPG